jgi:hypothetical protein
MVHLNYMVLLVENVQCFLAFVGHQCRMVKYPCSKVQGLISDTMTFLPILTSVISINAFAFTLRCLILQLD